MRLMRLRETTGDLCDSYRQLWTHTDSSYRRMTIIDSWGLMRLRETIGDSCDSAKLMETHETKGDKWRLLRLRKTTGN